ncbi:MAG: hypothetical protein A3B13_01600 [Candidatus Liptonbacteria bacterium RIFCSPLOWO2_01_FULL_45_15]|uniref:PEGA domain-containing protein n=1 Tax=Candidatus Liptonbacteria bacterium RIFCSPLOWO2_01_FULL_45_15 TaxID=1798649 RepID=A0A1G2CFL2_9BACT|nr:MAG: hypothetical protein A3B13_01600 [Candidatus Liptonbacteria bacterium RIFCSPLOWO2_01_FULL_45_15]
MTKRTRNTIFYALCAVFAAVGTLVVFYAQGWRLDFETFGLRKVGGIYLRSFPEDALVFINDKKVDKNPGLLDRGRFIGNLFPKNYKISFVGEDYLNWTEHVQVNPSLVSEIKYAVLVPKNSESAATGTVKNFWVDDGKLMVDADNNTLLFNGEKIKGNKVILQNGGSNIVLTESNSPQTYFINYLSGNTPTSTILNQKLIAYGIQLSKIKEIIKDPASGNQAVLRTADKIFSLDLRNGEISRLASSSVPVSEMAASPSWISWANADYKTGESVLTFYNRSSRSVQSETNIAGKLTKLFFRNDDELGILQGDGGLYTISSGGEPQKLASDVRDFEFSPSGDRVAALENQALEIFAFNREKDYWRFRLPSTEKIERVEWYKDENHIFIIYPDEIKFLDINDKNLENFPTIASGSNAKYDAKSNTLYFVKENQLRKIVFPK